MGPSGGDHHASVDRFKRQVGRPPPPVARLVSTQIWYSAEENKRTSSYARSNLSLSAWRRSQQQEEEAQNEVSVVSASPAARRYRSTPAQINRTFIFTGDLFFRRLANAGGQRGGLGRPEGREKRRQTERGRLYGRISSVDLYLSSPIGQ